MEYPGHEQTWESSWLRSVRKPGTGAGTAPRALAPSWHAERALPLRESYMSVPWEERPREGEEVVPLA